MSSIEPDYTMVYKTVGNLEIPLDLYLPKNATGVPVLLWFHGGGLIMGRRTSLAPYMWKGVEKYGYACVSADYRLCPQVTVADILEDVKDCVAFIRNKLSSRCPRHPSGAFDPSRLAVSGSSAGGYLAIMAGLYVEPKPKVIMPIYAITDPLGTFFTNPQPAPMGRYSPTQHEMAPYLNPRAEPVANCGPAAEDPRGHFYVYMMKAANLAALLSVPPGEEGDKFRLSRNVYRHSLPPAYFLHGDADSAVGVEQSDEVVGAALGCGLQVVYERLHGKDHFLDTAEDYENEAMFQFMMKHL